MIRKGEGGHSPEGHVSHHFLGHHGLEKVLVVHAVEHTGPEVFPVSSPCQHVVHLTEGKGRKGGYIVTK